MIREKSVINGFRIPPYLYSRCLKENKIVKYLVWSSFFSCLKCQRFCDIHVPVHVL